MGVLRAEFYDEVCGRIVDAFQTSAIEAVSDQKLKNLVSLFNLSGELLTG